MRGQCQHIRCIGNIPVQGILILGVVRRQYDRRRYLYGQLHLTCLSGHPAGPAIELAKTP